MPAPQDTAPEKAAPAAAPAAPAAKDGGIPQQMRRVVVDPLDVLTQQLFSDVQALRQTFNKQAQQAAPTVEQIKDLADTTANALNAISNARAQQLQEQLVVAQSRAAAERQPQSGSNKGIDFGVKKSEKAAGIKPAA